jgi:O-antigen ligase
MPPKVATAIFVVGILGLILLERKREERVSPALWIPLIWIFIGASRAVAQWLGLAPIVDDPEQQMLEGSPVDRNVALALLLLGLGVVLARARKFTGLLSKNWPLWLFVLYALLSTQWSEFPFVAFKRWTKTLGNIIMVLVILTDPRPLAAVRWVTSRAAFLLIPLSVLFVKFYPDLGRSYSIWTWTPFFQGVATGKNGLGVICFVFGLASLWRILGVLRSAEPRRAMRIWLAHGAVLVMALWLFSIADSMTSLVCFVAGGLVIEITQRLGMATRPTLVYALTASIVLLTTVILFFGVGAGVLEAMGRNPSLTGRTEIWSLAQSLVTNPVLGAGFESFWLGKRMEVFRQAYYFALNQAHNGYLETYLNLGWVGVGLLSFLILWGFRNVVRSMRNEPELGHLKLAYFVTALLYNMTEAALKVTHPVYIVFLLAITVVVQKPSEPAT